MTHFLDIGANIGQTFTDYLVPHRELHGCYVWCFEPSPRHFAELIQVAETYSSQFKITICPFALSSQNGYQMLHEKHDPRGDSLYESFYAMAGNITDREMPCQICVSTHLLSEFLSRFGSNDTVIIKIDAEASEYSILDDLLKHPNCLGCVSDIFVEYHGFLNFKPHDYNLAFERIGKPLKQWMF